MKELWDKHKFLIIGTAIVLVVLLLFVFGGWIAGTIGTIFGSGAAKKLQDYVKAETERDAQLAKIEEQKHAELAAYVAQEQTRKAEQYAQARLAQAEIKQRIDAAKTQADRDRAVDEEAAKLEEYLRKEGGFAQMGVLFVLILTLLILLLVCIPLPGFSAPTSQPVVSQAERTRAERTIRLLRMARRALQKQREKYAAALLRVDIEHKAQVKKLEVKLATCQKQKTILATPTACLPCWQPALVTGLVVAGVCGVAWGSVELGRHMGGAR